MRKLIVLLLLCAWALAGCSGVWMNAEYSQLLDETACLSAATAGRAAAGELDANQMAGALRAQSDVWQKLRAARDGGTE